MWPSQEPPTNQELASLKILISGENNSLEESVQMDKVVLQHCQNHFKTQLFSYLYQSAFKFWIAWTPKDVPLCLESLGGI